MTAGRRGRRLGPAFVAAAAALVVAATAGCDQAQPSGAAATPPRGTPSASGAAASPPGAATPGPAIEECALAPQRQGGRLIALGALYGSWQAHHEADTGQGGGFLPVLQDGTDRYTALECTTDGRVAAYTMTYIPGVSVADLRAAARAELPSDARQVADVTLDARCEVVRFTSTELAAQTGSDDPSGVADALITLTGNPDNVNEMTLSLGAPGTARPSLPSSC